MKVIAAIDLINGQCVRLEQGNYSKETVYSTSPVEVAKFWVSEGAERLHLVDLDGAKSGRLNNFEVIKDIRNFIDIMIDVGGGIRTIDDAKRMLDIGIDKVIFGTTAVKNPEVMKKVYDKYGDRVTVGIDAKNGRVQVCGWLGGTDILAEDLVKKLSYINEFIYTDIAKDGMLIGPNLEETKNICNITKSRVIASGGVSQLTDINKLLDLNCDNLTGVIIGKALYNKNFALKKAIAITKDS
ncbi:MAG: 1-(5-phosphoribosyl)-5-[(5-phosphoribosylamino)methylideneamino]imidazole-4-carboxamide isomerase [bacterium]|nr:1-(5-phosphoribosyl)-5-[(5-phosphoribosylamino)methylideneamino]imidazole-4-carboxamide isomerase [bacterium]